MDGSSANAGSLAFIYEIQYAGKSSIEKIAIIRKELKSAMRRHCSYPL